MIRCVNCTHDSNLEENTKSDAHVAPIAIDGQKKLINMNSNGNTRMNIPTDRAKTIQNICQRSQRGYNQNSKLKTATITNKQTHTRTNLH